MKLKTALLGLALLLITLSVSVSCPDGAAREAGGDLTDVAVRFTGNDGAFYQTRAEGCALWFDKWHFRLYGNEIVEYPDGEGSFKIDGKTCDSGLGFDGLTIEGLDKRGYAHIEYEIRSGSYYRLTGVFGFDDTTRYRPDSRLIVYADGRAVYRSDWINDDRRSADIDVPIKPHTREIAFRFKTAANKSVIPKLVFADIAAHTHKAAPPA